MFPVKPGPDQPSSRTLYLVLILKMVLYKEHPLQDAV